MNVSINKKEFDALFFAMDQIKGAIESASDEEYIQSAGEAERAIESIVAKYRKAQCTQAVLKRARVRY